MLCIFEDFLFSPFFVCGFIDPLLLLPRASNMNITPPPQKSRAQGTSEDGGPQVSVVGAGHDTDVPISMVVFVVDAIAAAGGATTTTGPVAGMSSSLR
jgi:hypothetical protein